MATPIPAERRIDGMAGEVWRDGVFQADIMEITGTIKKDRKEVMLPGTRNTAYKSGRVTREGTFKYQKVDDARETEFLQHLQDLDILRAQRDAGQPLAVTFNLLINLDDPEAWGASKLMLTGVQMWELEIGFNINDLVERSIPITWESEIQVETIVVPAS